MTFYNSYVKIKNIKNIKKIYKQEGGINMPKLIIELPTDTHEKLKEYAKEDDRSLKKYIERGLKYLSNNPYHTTTPITPSSAPTPTPTPTPTLTLEQLQEQGIAQIKFDKTTSQSLTPEQEELQRQKTIHQLDTLRESKIRFLKQKAKEMLGFLPDYLVDNNQDVINCVLDLYTTNEEIVKYLQEYKEKEGSYLYNQQIRRKEEKLNIPIDENHIYRKIRAYAIAHELTDDLYFVLEYPHFDIDGIRASVEDGLLRPALGKPPFSELEDAFTQEEQDELNKYLSWCDTEDDD